MPYPRFSLSKLSISVVASVLFLSGCNDDKTVINETVSSATLTEVITQNAKMAHAVYSDTVSTAETLKDAVTAFVAKDTPSDADLSELKTLWLAAREPYGLSEVWRFQEGPIDALNDDGTMGADGDGPEGRINAWPLGEALIDYVAEGSVDGDDGPDNQATSSGITNNIIADSSSVPAINKTVLAGLNEAGDDERNVATGYHAIEFLLWGQDLNEGVHSWTTSRDTSGGQRPVSDYNTNSGCTSGLNSSGAPVSQADSTCQRRKDYLVSVTELLVDDLTRLQTAWDPAGAGNYHDTFIAGGANSLAKMLEAMGRLGFGELAGERMNIALATDSQEDEHSCFSDNTHRDILLDAQGIVNTYIGSYTRVDGTVVDGPGIDDLLIASNADLDSRMQAALDESMDKIRAIDTQAKAGKPFDLQIRSIANGGDSVDRDRVTAAITALRTQTSLIEEAISALDVTTGDLCQDTAEFTCS